MTPDPATGRVLRALAIALVVIAAVLHVACGREPDRVPKLPKLGDQRTLSAVSDAADSARRPADSFLSVEVRYI